GVGQRLHDGAHVVGPAPVLGDEVPQDRLVGARPAGLGLGTGEVRQVPAGDRHRLGLVLDDDVDDAVGRLDLDRADVLGRVDAEAPALDHRRAAHADVGVAGGDDDV